MQLTASNADQYVRAVPDVPNRLHAIKMTEFVLYLLFLLCYAFAVLKQEREGSKRGRGVASNAAYIILVRIAVTSFRCKP